MDSAKENLIIAKSFVNSLKSKEEIIIDNFFKKYNLSLDLKEKLKEELNNINILQETKTFKLFKIILINKMQEYFFKTTFIGNNLNSVNGFLCDLINKKVIMLTPIEAKSTFKYLINSSNNKDEKLIEKEVMYNEEVANAKFNYFLDMQCKNNNEQENEI